MADETAVIDAGSTSTGVDTTSTSVDSSTSTAVDTQNTATTGEVVDTASTVDPNDPMAVLQAAMDAQLGADDAADAPSAPEAGAVPQEFEKILGISEFVKAPEHVEAAVRAADEVWKVASGQEPVSGLLEAMRAGNPQGFQKVFQDLAQYVEQVSGRKLTDAPATPPDPHQERMSKIEERLAKEDMERATAAWNQQVESARTKASEFIASKAKGTAFEGLEGRMLQMCGAAAGIPQEQMVQMLLQGKTDKLEAAYKSVTKDLGTLVKQINDKMVKNYRALSSGAPAVKGAAAKQNDSLAPLPGESPAQQAKRIWDQM